VRAREDEFEIEPGTQSTVEAEVYNPNQHKNSWRATVETSQIPSIGERVLAHLSMKQSEDVPIKVKNMDVSGNITFNVAVKDLLDDEERRELKGGSPASRRIGTFFVDAVGELLVRRNLEEFLSYLVKIKSNDLERLAKVQHATFGLLEKSDRTFQFIFHVSLLHRIFIDMVGVLTETNGGEG